MSTEIYIQEMANNVCRDIKPGFVIALCMEDGAAWVQLTGPDGYEIDLPDSADKSIEQQIKDAIFTSHNH